MKPVALYRREHRVVALTPNGLTVATDGGELEPWWSDDAITLLDRGPELIDADAVARVREQSAELKLPFNLPAEISAWHALCLNRPEPDMIGRGLDNYSQLQAISQGIVIMRFARADFLATNGGLYCDVSQKGVERVARLDLEKGELSDNHRRIARFMLSDCLRKFNYYHAEEKMAKLVELNALAPGEVTANDFLHRLLWMRDKWL